MPFKKLLRQHLPFLGGVAVGLLIPLYAVVGASPFAPSLSITSLSSGAIVRGSTLLSAVADAPGISSVRFRVGSRYVGPEITSGTCLVNWDTRAESNGTYTVSIEARDAAGNSIVTTPITVTVSNSAIVDSTAPVVSLIAPVAGSTLTGSVLFAATASDSSGVAGVWFLIDGAPVGGEDASAPYQISIPTDTLTNGTHSVQAAARDAAFNVGLSAVSMVSLSNAIVKLPVGGCATPDPFTIFGGGICVNGGWLVPVTAPPASSSAPSSSAATSTTTRPTTCTTPDPFAILGGGVCVQGGWLPKGLVLPSSTAPPSASSAVSPSALAGGCVIPDPFVILGGGTCIRGGWVPPGMVLR